MALGATAPVVVREVLSRVMIVVGIGIAFGFGTTLWVSQFIAGLLYSLEPRDPATLVGAGVVLIAAGTLAGWLPAWRASRVDPIIALRHE